MRKAKVPIDELLEKVWASLRARRDPDTLLVRPSWRTLMRETGVCRQRIADAIRFLKEKGRLEAVEVQRPNGTSEICYELSGGDELCMADEENDIIPSS